MTANTDPSNRLSAEQIPPRVPADRVPLLRTELDVYRYWRMMLAPLGFGHRCLWLNVTDQDGRISPAVQRIEDVPPRPDSHSCAALLELCRRFSPPGYAAAFLYSRPGRHRMTSDDLSWAQGLRRAAADAGVALWPVYFANDAVLQAAAAENADVAR